MHTVSAEPSVAPIVARTIANLPVSLTWATGAAELHAVDGRAGWPGRAAQAARSGVLGVLIVHPVAISHAELEALRSGLGTTALVLDWMYGSSPAVDQLREWRPETPGLLECTALAPTGADTARQLLEITAWLRRALAADFSTCTAHPTADGARVTATIRLRDVPSTGILRVLHTDSTTPKLEVTWTGRAQHLRATFFTPDTARPAVITVTEQQSETTFPAIFEDAHRASWKRLLNTIDGSPSATSAEIDHLGDAVGVRSLTPGSFPVSRG